MSRAVDPLSAWLDSYRADLRSNLDRAVRDGFRSVAASTTGGGIEPGDFTQSAQRHLARHLEGLGVSLSSLGAEFPGDGLADEQLIEQRLARLRETLDLCRGLHVPVATVTLAGIGDERRDALARQALAAAAELSDRCGVRLAVRSPEGTDALAAAVRALGCPTLGVALDSSSLSPPAQGVLPQAGAVILRDVRRAGGRVEETDFGTGDVDFAGLLGALAAGDYRGVLIVRRDGAGAAVDALRRGREYIAGILAGFPS